MGLTQDDLNELATIFLKNIQEEFALKHLSGNLVGSLQLVAEKDSVKIIIPAQTYDMYAYVKQGIIIPNSSGSYASELDINGSKIFGHQISNHKGYIDKIINQSIEEWVSIKNIEVAKRTDTQ